MKANNEHIGGMKLYLLPIKKKEKDVVLYKLVYTDIYKAGR